MLQLAFIFGCTTESEQYRRALTAPAYEASLAACEAIRSEPTRSECLTAISERHSRPIDACEAITEPRWKQECFFMFAERAAAQGELDAAFAACERTPEFGRHCSYHLIRDAAALVLDQPPSALKDAALPYRSLTRAPDAEQLFFQAYYRQRLKNGLLIDPTGCPSLACEMAANDEQRTRLPSVMARSPKGCDTSPEEFAAGVWAHTPLTEHWTLQWKARHCPGSPPPPNLPKGPAAP